MLKYRTYFFYCCEKVFKVTIGRVMILCDARVVVFELLLSNQCLRRPTYKILRNGHNMIFSPTPRSSNFFFYIFL